MTPHTAQASITRRIGRSGDWSDVSFEVAAAVRVSDVDHRLAIVLGG